MQIITQKTESAHWYDRQGNPQHTIVGKSTGKPRPTTISDARKNDWLPSVTTILKVLHKPALERWKIAQGVLAIVTAPDMPGEALDAKIDRILNQEEQQHEEASAAAKLGSDIHSALESALHGKQYPEELRCYVEPTMGEIKNLIFEHEVNPIAMEQSVVGNGYAGMTDLILGCDTLEILIDFKTTKSIPKSEPWNEHKIQLAAYAATRKSELSKRIFNLYISTKEPGKVSLLDCGDWGKLYLGQFLPLLTYWKHANDFGV
jgi:CRISPR/Cas system-associated exonuclease Cas4 (RecB family)